MLDGAWKSDLGTTKCSLCVDTLWGHTLLVTKGHDEESRRTWLCAQEALGNGKEVKGKQQKKPKKKKPLNKG